MIRPSSAPVPWAFACLTADFFCMTGRAERYIAGDHSYEGPEPFADSASLSESRFNYYQKKRSEEPLFQMSAASYGWLWQTVRLNRWLQTRAWRQITCPVVLFQAERETYVSKREQERFIRKLSRKKNGDVKLFKVKGSKHEIFQSGEVILERYWKMMFKLLYEIMKTESGKARVEEASSE